VDPTASALVRANPLEPATSPARSAKAIPATAPLGGANAEAPPAPKGGEFTEPPGTGFVVQVAATKSRAEATTIARRLTGKGYPAFVTVPGSRSPKVFRVRVGKYKDRKEVDSVAGRLRKEEQFKPWITR
jgi:cell division septation protein DedD